MQYAFLFLVGFTALYTWLALWAPLGADFPRPWPGASGGHHWKIIIVHSLFLIAYLSISAWLIYRQPSFPWLSEGGLRHVGVLHLFIAGVFMAIFERILLARRSEPRNFDSNGKEQKPEPDHR